MYWLDVLWTNRLWNLVVGGSTLPIHTRIQALENRLMDLERDHPAWAAFHFNQPRGINPEGLPVAVVTGTADGGTKCDVVMASAAAGATAKRGRGGTGSGSGNGTAASGSGSDARAVGKGDGVRAVGKGDGARVVAKGDGAKNGGKKTGSKGAASAKDVKVTKPGEVRNRCNL